jgi:desulfoferrodoxin-like iron-binding protein
MKIFICQVCGHISFDSVPELCPVCFSPKEKFQQNDKIFIESKAKSPEAEVKHLPQITLENKCGLIPEIFCRDALIRIGKVLHPMEEKHFIVFIDCYLDGKYVERIHLTANGVYPAGTLHIKNPAKKLTVVINCNIHGYWMSELAL